MIRKIFIILANYNCTFSLGSTTGSIWKECFSLLLVCGFYFVPDSVCNFESFELLTNEGEKTKNADTGTTWWPIPGESDEDYQGLIVVGVLVSQFSHRLKSNLL